MYKVIRLSVTTSLKKSKTMLIKSKNELKTSYKSKLFLLYQRRFVFLSILISTAQTNFMNCG